MMKTVAFLLLLSSTNAARSDNDELDRGDTLIASTRNHVALEEIETDNEMTEDDQDLSRQASTASNLIDDDENQHSQQEDPSLLIIPEDQKEGAQSQLIQPEEVQNDATNQSIQPVDEQEDAQIKEVTEEEKKTLLGKFKGNFSRAMKTTSSMAGRVGSSIKSGALAARNGVGRAYEATENGVGRAYQATREGVVKTYKGARNVAENCVDGVCNKSKTLKERSLTLVDLVQKFHGRAIVAAVVLAISWVVVPWFIVRKIVEFITSKPKAGVISALITMFLVIPAALFAVLLHENTFNKVEAFLKEDFFGPKKDPQDKETVGITEIIQPDVVEENVHVTNVSEEDNN